MQMCNAMFSFKPHQVNGKGIVCTFRPSSGISHPTQWEIYASLPSADGHEI